MEIPQKQKEVCVNAKNSASSSNDVLNDLNDSGNLEQKSLHEVSPAPKTLSQASTKTHKKYFRLYCEEVVNTFFRRLTFTPDGGLLLTPAGQYQDSIIDMIQNKEKNSSNSNINSPMKNTVYLFARNRLDK